MKTLRDLPTSGCMPAALILAALLLLAGCTGRFQPNLNNAPLTPVNGAGLAATR